LENKAAPQRDARFSQAAARLLELEAIAGKVGETIKEIDDTQEAIRQAERWKQERDQLKAENERLVQRIGDEQGEYNPTMVNPSTVAEVIDWHKAEEALARRHDAFGIALRHRMFVTLIETQVAENERSTSVLLCGGRAQRLRERLADCDFALGGTKEFSRIHRAERDYFRAALETIAGGSEPTAAIVATTALDAMDKRARPNPPAPPPPRVIDRTWGAAFRRLLRPKT